MERHKAGNLKNAYHNIPRLQRLRRNELSAGSQGFAIAPYGKVYAVKAKISKGSGKSDARQHLRKGKNLSKGVAYRERSLRQTY